MSEMYICPKYRACRRLDSVASRHCFHAKPHKHNHDVDCDSVICERFHELAHYKVKCVQISKLREANQARFIAEQL